MAFNLMQFRRLMHPDRTDRITDDFRILDSWTEYENKDYINPEKRKLRYLCYELEMIDPTTGDRRHIYKAIRFARVTRLPESAKQSTSFMSMQEKILTSVYENQYNLITIIANIIKPVSLGLLYLYGVQGVASTIDEAKAIVDADFVGFIHAMQGKFRVLEMTTILAEETEWLREKLYHMDYLTVVKGIPWAEKAGEDAGNKGMGGSNVNPDSQGTLEDLITGMVHYEYVVEVLMTPVYKHTIEGWQANIENNMTAWYSKLQGTESINMNVSMPVMYMANIGTSGGWNQGINRGTSVSFGRGTNMSTSSGQSVGQSLTQGFGRNFGRSAGTSFSTSYTQGASHTRGVSFGETFGATQGVGRNVSYGQTHGISENLSNSISHGTSRNVSFGQSHGFSVTQGQNTGQSQNLSLSSGRSQNIGNSLSNGLSSNSTHSVSNGTSYNMSQGRSTGLSHNVGQGMNYGISQNQSISQGRSANIGESMNRGVSQSFSDSYGASQNSGWSQGWNASSSHGQSGSVSGGASGNNSYSLSDSSNLSNGNSSSSGTNGSVQFKFFAGGSVGANKSNGVTVNLGNSSGGGETHSSGWNASFSNGETLSNTLGQSAGLSGSNGFSHNMGASFGSTSSYGQSVSNGASLGFSQGYGLSQGVSANESYGTNVGASLSQGFGANHGVSDSASLGQSMTYGSSIGAGISNGVSQGIGTSQGTSLSVGENVSQSVSQGYGVNDSVSQSHGYGVSDSQSFSQGYSESLSASHSKNFGQSESVGISESLGQSVGKTSGITLGQSASLGYGQNIGRTEGISNGQSQSLSNGTTEGVSHSTSGSTSIGTSSSMGVGPSIGYSRSNQWMNQGVKNLLELMEFNMNRVKEALRGNGAFYTYVYIGCQSLDALAAAKAVAKSTWNNEFAMTHPLQILDLTETEQKHLLYKFSAFSADISRETVANVEQYKYCSVLLPKEAVAYTHLPRVSEGGVFSIVPDIPKFSAPSNMAGDIYIGTVLNPERYDFDRGYKTYSDYRIPESMLMHGFFTGASRSGKTVAAMRFVAELAKVRRNATNKRLRIVVMDPKQDWRALARFIEPERFHFYSLGNPDFMPVCINVWKIPMGVRPQLWIDGIIDIYCRAYGFLERGKQMIAQVVYDEYAKAGVMDVDTSQPGWQQLVHDKSSNVCFNEIYQHFVRDKEAQYANGRKPGNATIEGYDRILERLSCFSRPYSIESRMYGTKDGMCIDELIGEDDITVLESKGLERTFSSFIFGAITSGFYKYAFSHDKGFLANDQYETVLVIEEANEVLTGKSDNGGSDASLTGQSEFEQILDQSAGYGLFVIAITQKIADMPSSIIANAGLVFAGRLVRKEDVETVIRAIGREERIDDRPTVKWLPRSPIGWFICKTSRGYNFTDADPVLVSVARLNVNTPSNDELEYIMAQREALTRLHQQNIRDAG